jgi:hypothetical protein
MDEFEWTYDTDGWVALQQVDGVEAGFALHVNQVLKVPTREVIDAGDGADGDMARVVSVIRGYDVLTKVSQGQFLHFRSKFDAAFYAASPRR